MRIAQSKLIFFKAVPKGPGIDITSCYKIEEVNVELFLPHFHAAGQLPLPGLTERQEVYSLEMVKQRDSGL